LRLHAETSLLQSNPGHVAPMLRATVRARTPVVLAIRAALLLHRMRDQHGAELLRHLVLDSALRAGQYGEMLRRAANTVLDPHHYIRQATSALARLEQRPDSVTAITGFRHAADILCFLRAPVPFPFLERALFVRAVGGENLSLVREVLRGTQGVAIEHVCLVRKEAVLLLLHQPDRERACARLMQALAHPNPAVQLTTMYGLAEMRDPRAIDALLPIASDPDSPIRDEAQELIARLGHDAPDVLTLLRAAPRHIPAPGELLRPTRPEEDDPHTLLRPRKME
jgi:hypothetical protein